MTMWTYCVPASAAVPRRHHKIYVRLERRVLVVQVLIWQFGERFTSTHEVKQSSDGTAFYNFKSLPHCLSPTAVPLIPPPCNSVAASQFPLSPSGRILVPDDGGVRMLKYFCPPRVTAVDRSATHFSKPTSHAQSHWLELISKLRVLFI